MRKSVTKGDGHRRKFERHIPGGYVVRDANGQTVAWVYAREDDAVARQAKVPTMDEARWERGSSP